MDLKKILIYHEYSFVGIFKWIIGQRDETWMGFLTRSVLENATSFSEAQTKLANTTMLAPVYFILGGNSTGEVTIVLNIDFLRHVLNSPGISKGGVRFKLHEHFLSFRRPLLYHVLERKQLISGIWILLRDNGTY